MLIKINSYGATKEQNFSLSNPSQGICCGKWILYNIAIAIYSFILLILDVPLLAHHILCTCIFVIAIYNRKKKELEIIND